MFRFVPSASMKVELLPGQEKWLSTPEKIAKQLYEKVGFRQFQVWDEPGCHEVDLEYIPAPVGREEKGATL